MEYCPKPERIYPIVKFFVGLNETTADIVAVFIALFNMKTAAAVSKMRGGQCWMDLPNSPPAPEIRPRNPAFPDIRCLEICGKENKAVWRAMSVYIFCQQ
jgi:hypothetical protein